MTIKFLYDIKSLTFIKKKILLKLGRCYRFGPIFKKCIKSLSVNFSIQDEKLRNNDFAHSFENRTKLIIPYDIKPPLKTSKNNKKKKHCAVRPH